MLREGQDHKYRPVAEFDIHDISTFMRMLDLLGSVFPMNHAPGFRLEYSRDFSNGVSSLRLYMENHSDNDECPEDCRCYYHGVSREKGLFHDIVEEHDWAIPELNRFLPEFDRCDKAGASECGGIDTDGKKCDARALCGEATSLCKIRRLPKCQNFKVMSLAELFDNMANLAQEEIVSACAGKGPR
jgi:hypothetical protein